jgi:hypothetical protein
MPSAPHPDVCQPTGSAELAMLDVYMPMMKSAAIISAGRLGLFEALADGPLTADELAGKIASSLQGTTKLADFWSRWATWKNRATILPTRPARNAGSPVAARSITRRACYGPTKPGR